jgi:hypothetical protein
MMACTAEGPLLGPLLYVSPNIAQKEGVFMARYVKSICWHILRAAVRMRYMVRGWTLSNSRNVSSVSRRTYYDWVSKDIYSAPMEGVQLAHCVDSITFYLMCRAVGNANMLRRWSLSHPRTVSGVVHTV